MAQGCAAMKCHGDRLPGRDKSTGAKNTMSSMVKPAKELHECDVCGMPGDGVSFQMNAGYEEDGDTGDVFPR